MSKGQTFAEWLNEEPGRLIIIKPGIGEPPNYVSFYCHTKVEDGRKVYATVNASVDYLMIPAVGEMIVDSVKTSIAGLLAGEAEHGTSERIDEIMEDNDGDQEADE